nr:hypothetical protein [uncultured Undibacterium sp.]
MTKLAKARSFFNKLISFVFIFVWFGLVATPLYIHFFVPNSDNVNGENRQLALLPLVPVTFQDRLSWPEKMDRYLNDHFGLRMEMIEWNNALHFGVFGDLNSVQLTSGKGGFLFFNSHSAQDPLSMIHFLCGRRTKSDDYQRMATTASTFMHSALATFPNSHFLVVPTKPVVYQEKLPDWLQQQCTGLTPPVPEIVAQLRLDPSLAARIIFPLTEMRAKVSQHEFYTKATFHWVGDGAKPVAQLVASDFFHLPSISTLSNSPKKELADMQSFLPGVRLEDSLREPNYQKAGITECRGAACFPEFSTFSAKIGDLSRFTQNEKKGPKLLIVSDSFGRGIAGMFSEYFGEVWHISVNNFKTLDPTELSKVQDISLNQYKPDHVLFLWHDFSIGYFDQNAKIFLKTAKN